jgi:hypothetical protein
VNDLDKIRARIRQLRKMTVENGCTEAEAMRAAEIALKLMDRYGLRDGDVEFETASPATPGRRRQVIDGLWNTVAWVCGCQGWTTRRGGRLRYVYFGRPSDVLVAEYLHELLAGAYRRECEAFKATKEYLKRRTRRTRSAAVKAFQAGMVAMLRHNLLGLWWRKVPETEAARAALLDSHKKHLALLDGELARRGFKFGTIAAVKLADRRFDDARWRGHLAADNVAIDPGMGGVGGPVGLLPGAAA